MDGSINSLLHLCASMKMPILIIHESFLLLIMFIGLSSHVVPSLSFTSFVFGDSLVDAGNNDYFFTRSKADSPPYGIDFIPSRGQPTGRFTNGRTISDIIDEALGPKSFPPPYLAPNTATTSILNGMNYASGASGILDETGTLFIGRVPLREHIEYFGWSRAYMVNLMGENGTRKFLAKAIFSLTIGSNDILNYFQPSFPFFRQQNVPQSIFQDYLISNLNTQLKRLYELGAQKFVVVGVGPLGCIPFVRALQLIPPGQCSVMVNSLIQGYNRKLKELIGSLNRKMGPEAMFVYGNAYNLVFGIISNYQKYGFENAEEMCCGGFVCHTRKGSPNLCNDRASYVFWDAYHPTEATNVVIAEKLLDGDKTSCSPINIRELYNYNH